MTVGVLKPYRKLGLGNDLKKRNTLIYTHVSVGDEAAKAFFGKRGFTEKGVEGLAKDGKVLMVMELEGDA
ncbi:hypothetical protein BC829DRAFT_398283 [Chytridium lagenaria]|nr:hypothetical protein BC829DRAFT_398283 [Chytridium lagenaria]